MHFWIFSEFQDDIELRLPPTLTSQCSFTSKKKTLFLFSHTMILWLLLQCLKRVERFEKMSMMWLFCNCWAPFICLLKAILASSMIFPWNYSYKGLNIDCSLEFLVFGYFLQVRGLCATSCNIAIVAIFHLHTAKKKSYKMALVQQCTLIIWQITDVIKINGY